ncbi:MAG: hypothetical protein HUK22_04100 [Thermoguttaceae bacterium]|nr:hypothetical protein [Thermoguttaceae bacterium]
MKFSRTSKIAVVAALTFVAALGCATRKQYQINEAILISERRQLEDELYRVQFELRDALEENERLTAELKKAAANSGAAMRTVDSGLR